MPGGPYLPTPDDDPAYLYHDWLVALDAARGINIGEPGLHARCLDALALRDGETVLHIGAGAGYYTAIIAHLVGPAARVHAFEIEPALAERARHNLSHLPNVEVHERSGIGDGLPRADAVYVNASAVGPSRSWLDTLHSGGRLIFPLHAPGGFGAMLKVTRPEQGLTWPASFVCPAGFIACDGLQDEPAGRRLAAAFAGGGSADVRSLRLDTTPDGTCWFGGEDWWLSSYKPPATVLDRQGPQAWFEPDGHDPGQPALVGLAAAHLVDERLAHHAGRECEEMGAVVPVDPFELEDAHGGFVGEVGRLQGELGAVVAQHPAATARNSW